MKNLAPCLWFSDGNCEEAIQYYVDTFPDFISSKLSVTRMPL
ncbi:VOC family protein [Aerococcus agrisoli]|nr:VOC family protein [Aerococcus agrisoli]